MTYYEWLARARGQAQEREQMFARATRARRIKLAQAQLLSATNMGAVSFYAQLLAELRGSERAGKEGGRATTSSPDCPTKFFPNGCNTLGCMSPYPHSHFNLHI